MYKSDLNGNLVDFADAPFFKGMEGDWIAQMGAQGLAFDGQNLWALDAKDKRICVIEKAVRLGGR